MICRDCSNEMYGVSCLPSHHLHTFIYYIDTSRDPSECFNLCAALQFDMSGSNLRSTRARFAHVLRTADVVVKLSICGSFANLDCIQ
jgi:hypothetical protein